MAVVWLTWTGGSEERPSFVTCSPEHVANRICICSGTTGVQPGSDQRTNRQDGRSPPLTTSWRMATITLLQLNGVDSLIMQTAHIWMVHIVYMCVQMRAAIFPDPDKCTTTLIKRDEGEWKVLKQNPDFHHIQDFVEFMNIYAPAVGTRSAKAPAMNIYKCHS